MVVQVTSEEMQTGQTGCGAQRSAFVYEPLARDGRAQRVQAGRSTQEKVRHFRTGANF